MHAKVSVETATCVATPNIAVVKYWGMRDARLVLPANPSLSFTMDETLSTVTTACFCSEFPADEAWIDGKKLKRREMGRISAVLSTARKIAAPKKKGLKARIVSKNNFPSSAGLASSASGIAALSCAVAKALELGIGRREMSMIARMGSGSACRSVFGGFVEWGEGARDDGTDSYAKQIHPASHWPQLRNVIALANSKRKKVPSNKGMQMTMRTSALFKRRLACLPGAIAKMKKAVAARDYPAFAGLLMAESDSMHSCMVDTKPPLHYLNATSKEIIDKVQKLNSASSDPATAYTFDAGPNAHLYTLEKNVNAVKKMLAEIDGMKEVRVCKIGNGPRSVDKHLIDENGNPILP